LVLLLLLMLPMLPLPVPSSPPLLLRLQQVMRLLLTT
jgi:hypothetical protein